MTINKYRSYLLLEKGLSANTCAAYVQDVSKLLQYLTDEHIDPCRVTLADLHGFAASLYDLGIAVTSIARILSGVRSYYDFLLNEGYIEDDPTELLESPRKPEHLPEVLTLDEVERLKAAIDLSQAEGQRDRAIIEVLYSCGLRVSELCALKLSDLFLDEGFMRVTGKGSKQRFVPVSPQAITELELWFADRCHIEAKPGEEDYVFVSHRRGKHLSRITVFHNLQVYAERAGINKKFRHTPCATPLPPTCSKAGPTCAPYRPCWGTKALPLPNFTPISTAPFCVSKYSNTCRATRTKPRQARYRSSMRPFSGEIARQFAFFPTFAIATKATFMTEVKQTWKEKGYVDEPLPAHIDVKAEIRRLCQEKNAIILAHYYTEGEIQDIADYVGDSLGLAQQAAKTDADIIVMCGVHFMGETNKILCPDKRCWCPTSTPPARWPKVARPMRSRLLSKAIPTTR